MVQTRLQIKRNAKVESIQNPNPNPKVKQLYKVNIDFDEASREWRANKKSIGNSHYKYICQIITKTGNQCGKVCYKNAANCWTHRKTSKNNIQISNLIHK